jgi:hypothetical protein
VVLEDLKVRNMSKSAKGSGEFSATSKASSEKEKRTCPRSGHVYGELDALRIAVHEPKKVS